MVDPHQPQNEPPRPDAGAIAAWQAGILNAAGWRLLVWFVMAIAALWLLEQSGVLGV